MTQLSQNISNLSPVEMKNSKELLDVALEAAEYGAWYWDLQTNQVLWDERQYKIFGTSKEEFGDAYKAFETFIHPEDKDRVWNEAQRAIRENTDFECTFRVVHSNKEVRYVKGRGKVTYGPDGTPLRMNGLNWDCTKQILQEQKLKESEERFKQAFEHAAIGMALVSTSGQFLQINKSFCKFLGYSEQEMLNLDFQTITHPDDLQKDLNYLKKLESGEISNYQMEKRYFTKDRHIMWIQLSASAVRDKEGNVIHYIAQVQNIHDAKKDRELVEKRNKQLLAVNKDLERFAYVASHDLQEPLRKIRSFLEIIEKELDGKLDEQQQKYFSFVIDGANRMRQLIVDLLDYSRAGQNDLNLKELDLSSLIQNALLDLEYAIKDKNVQVHFQSKPLTCYTTPLLERVFNNIISNAIKFTPNESAQIWIDVKAQDHAIEVSIKDNGIGMPEESLKSIFEIFKRLNPRSEYPGTGIGLAISKKIIDRINGRLLVESKTGVGSVFKIVIPVIRKEIK